MRESVKGMKISTSLRVCLSLYSKFDCKLNSNFRLIFLRFKN